MELSISLNYLMLRRGTSERRRIEEAADICRKSGFKYVDYTPEFCSDEWAKIAAHDREALENASITVEQTHAPFNRYCQYDDGMFFEYYKRVFEASKILGAKYVVVHADEYRTKDRYDEKEIIEYTYDYLAPYVEYAEKNGMTVAIENVFEDNTYRWPQIDGKSRFTSRIEELKEIIERFDTPSVACCWDFGHAKCAFGKDGMTDAMKRVGKHIVCTHVHDNYHEKDLHLVPFAGDADWEQNISCLKSVGYSGKLSFEFAYGAYPDELIGVWLKYVHATGEYLAGLFDKA